MSYSEHFSGSVTLSTNVSYPASENGGSKYVTMTEPINITVTVHDEPFKHSADLCSANVLTVDNSILQSAKAQARAKSEAAKKISKTIVGGFFEYNKADFSQKVVALQNEINAEAPKLLTYMKQLSDIRNRMEHDFNLISRRYIDIFQKFDDELNREIHRMYGPCFVLFDECMNSLVSDIPTDAQARSLGFENVTAMQSMIVTSIMKRKLQTCMGKIGSIVGSTRHLDSVFDQYCSDMDTEKETTTYLPAVVFQPLNDDDSPFTECTFCQGMTGQNREIIEESICSAVRNEQIDISNTPQERSLMESEFMKMMENEPSERKKREMLRLWKAFSN